MSFGAKQYQHRFFTAPKARIGQMDHSMSPEINRSRYNNSINPPPNSHTHLQQSTLKQSYLRMMANQRNSRIHSKYQLGYQSLKVQKDVINRYSQDDYKQKADILERFKREAEELKRKKKYRHVSVVNRTENINNNGNNYSLQNDDKMKTQRRENYSKVLQQNLHNQQNISLLPITNNNSNVSRVTILKRLKLPSIISYGFKDPVVQEDESQNQHQFLGQDDIIEESTFYSRVCDVGVTANLNIGNQVDHNHRRKTIQNLHLNEANPIARIESQSSKVQMLRYKNKHLKKKYEKLKKQLSRKAKQLSKQKHISQNNEPDQQFQHKIQNLSQMIHTLCDKLKQNNSKIQISIKTDDNPNHDGLHQQQNINCNINSNSDNIHNNQTQINLSNPAVEPQNEQMRTSKMMIQTKYVSEIGRIDGFRKTRPRIVYTLNRDLKNVSFDPLRLLKNRINEQTFIPSNDDFISRRRIKTQNY